MVEQLRYHHGNPSGAHRVAREARKALEDSRDQVAAIVGVSPHGVVFTSGGTEADNLAVYGVVAALGGVAVCGSTEHHAVLDPVEHLGGRIVKVDSGGHIDLDHLADVVDQDVSLVSIMAVNNETGVIADLAGIAAVVRANAPTAVLHSDAVQASNWLDLGWVFDHVDAISLAGHKFGGPNGCGALVVRDGVKIEPLVRGGGQEQERRSGTQNVAAAVAFGVAIELTQAERTNQVARITQLNNQLLEGVTAIAGVEASVATESRVPGLCHFTTSVESEALLFLLEQAGIMASAASSCASGALQPSHVLTAMGRTDAQAAGALRLSMSHSSTTADVEHLLSVLPSCIDQLTSGQT